MDIKDDLLAISRKCDEIMNAISCQDYTMAAYRLGKLDRVLFTLLGKYGDSCLAQEENPSSFKRPIGVYQELKLPESE